VGKYLRAEGTAFRVDASIEKTTQQGPLNWMPSVARLLGVIQEVHMEL